MTNIEKNSLAIAACKVCMGVIESTRGAKAGHPGVDMSTGSLGQGISMAVGMTVLCLSDDVEAHTAVKAAYEHESPVYLRFGRLAIPVFHDEETFKFKSGKGEQFTERNDVAIVSTGLMVDEALKDAEMLRAEGIVGRVINICTIKPLDKEIILKAAKECGNLVAFCGFVSAGYVEVTGFFYFIENCVNQKSVIN